MSEFDREEEYQESLEGEQQDAKPDGLADVDVSQGSAETVTDVDIPQESAETVTEEYPGQPDELPQEDGRAWYVVHCYSGYENKVRHNLEQRIESMGMKDRI